MISNSLPIDAALRTRAQRVIPGGMYGHLNVARLPPGYPQFFARAEGATLWDVDGNAYVDFMCAYGPDGAGLRQPRGRGRGRRPARAGRRADRPVGAAGRAGRKAGRHGGARRLGDVPENGTDATTLCVVVARAATKKRKILVARGAYHGAAPWCTPHPAGTTAEDRVHLVHYDYNDVASLLAAAQSAEGDIAGVIASAFKHDYGKDQELPTRPSPRPCARFATRLARR